MVYDPVAPTAVSGMKTRTVRNTMRKELPISFFCLSAKLFDSVKYLFPKNLDLHKYFISYTFFLLFTFKSWILVGSSTIHSKMIPYHVPVPVGFFFKHYPQLTPLSDTINFWKKCFIMIWTNVITDLVIHKLYKFTLENFCFTLEVYFWIAITDISLKTL